MDSKREGRSGWCRVALIAVLASACSDAGSVRAQAPDRRLHPALVAHLAGLQDEDFVPVVLHPEEGFRLGPEDRRAVLRQATGATPRERRLDGRQRLVAEHRQRATDTHADLLAALAAGESAGVIRRVRNLWILNAVACEVRKSFLDQILATPAAERLADAGVRLDLPRRVWRAGPATGPTAVETGWGLETIGADDVWSSSGVTGDDVVIAVIDNGFNPLHPALQDRIVDAWDFSDGDGNVTGTHYHGTAVASIAAGSPVGGTSTGVAPGASLMLLRVGDGTSTAQAEVWDAMQHALDNGANVVNLSMQWKEFQDPDYASWRTAIDVLTVGGALVVTAAGNEAGGVTTPGNVPAALTVGATNSSDVLWFEGSSSYLPAKGSNTGPVSWQGVAGFEDYPDPPGLLKPDVVAPGVKVLAADLVPPATVAGTGTSYATPHAAGLAALLLEADPDLGPYDLRYLIQESAAALGDLHPNVEYGWGRIDASAAAGLLPIEDTAYDLALTPTDDEWSTSALWVDNDLDDDVEEDTPVALSENLLHAHVRNLGGQVVGDVVLKFYYADVATIGFDSFDPDGDGDPSDGDFEYIGSYEIPVLGPSGSKHDNAIGVVSWEIPEPTSDHWCVGVAAVAPAPNAPEADVTNNVAFRNFFELVVKTSARLEFKVQPPRTEPRAPFDLVIERLDLPPEVPLFLGVDGALAPAFEAARGRPRRGPRDGPRRPPHEEGEPMRVRLPLQGDVVRFDDLEAPRGEPIPVELIVYLPPETDLPDDARVTIRVLDAAGQAAGGLTVKVIRSSGRAGPYPVRIPD